MRRYSWLSHEDRRILRLADQLVFFERSSPGNRARWRGAHGPGPSRSAAGWRSGPSDCLLCREGRSSRSASPMTAARRPIWRSGWRRGAHIASPALRPWCTTASVVMTRPMSVFVSRSHLSPGMAAILDRSASPATGRGRVSSPTLPEGLGSRVTFARIPAGDGAGEEEGLDPALRERHQPILLAAPGVIFDASILDLLIDCILEGRTRISTVSQCAVEQPRTSRKRRRKLADKPCRPILPRWVATRRRMIVA